ncbi:DUF1097 domain-containing protein [Cronobacter sakazakii]|uniref:DUF1097 domain-containing protein n=1 Tax=Cronobacter sakazakii TaxID=28141 RepID=UPI000CF088F1|nr:DUF1097 domain-containing protein [Cronobacter sakazakii]EJQ2006116.1 DUF1097 domain-containing protein [Cronobacter sakazakii]EJQ2088072.1 DUF1097 domain-containing protein [Cronobacter sakazakii]EJR9312038.1 DUF1097 domain-containing protein [Cronobacter sakazakii]EJR9316660.1 DUF1097 domain-containing protein [Cronobacter sakazakii]EJR9321192.1 DUF1097 domain-containing protein [Cronobacter sakazakii]
MNRHFSLALTTGLLSALWAWAAVALGLPSWAGFLGCTAWFASPKGGVTGFLTILFTLGSGVLWAQVIIAGSAVAPGVTWLSYAMTGVVAFLMCIQSRQTLLSFVPGTFIGACATFAAQGDWKNVLPALLLGLLFGVAMKASGQWLAGRAAPKSTTVAE